MMKSPLSPQIKICDLLSCTLLGLWLLCTPPHFLEFLARAGREVFSIRVSFSTSLPASFWQRLICLFDSWTPVARRNNPHVCRVLPKGTGWREEGRASCQQPNRQGRDVGRPHWPWRVRQMFAGRGSAWEGAGSRGSWEITRDGRSQEAEGSQRQLATGKGRRGWLEAEEAHGVGRCWWRSQAWAVVAAHYCMAFHCLHSILTYIVVRV